MGGGYSKPRAIATKYFPAFASALPAAAFASKTFAVTGCTSGTGLVLATLAAQRGANVVMLNRSSVRADAALERVRGAAAPGARVTSVACDLQSFASVRAAATELRAALGDSGLDVLVCNAGVMALADEATVDGYDVQMQANHLGHFLLAHELMPQLERAAELRGEARIVSHSSGARNFPGAALDAKYLGKNGGALGGNSASMFFAGARWVRYHHTKLANAVFTVALAEKLRARGSKVKALCAAPGLAATNLQVTTAAAGGMAETWIMRFAQSAEDGTMPLLQCAVGAAAASGELWEPKGITGLPVRKPLEALSTDPRARAMLWKESEAACGAWAL